MPDAELTTRTAVVTGGGQGIGRGIVQRLVADGWRVAVLERDRHAGRDAAAEYGDQVRFVATDVSRERSVAAALRAVARWTGGGLDAVVANAGLADPESGPIEELSVARWRRVLATNLDGVFLVVKHAVPLLRPRRGAIVTIASTRALQSEPDTEAYAASKGGIVALSHALAVSLGPDIRVNCISPGWIATDELLPRDQRHPARLSRRDHAQHPAGRVGRPADVAALCAWLLSEEAGFVTGGNYVIDGGMTRKMSYA